MKCNHKHKAKEGGGGWRGLGGGVKPKELKLQQRGSETPADKLQILQEGSFSCRSHTLLTVTLKWPLGFQQQSKQTRGKKSPLRPSVIVLPAGGAQATHPLRREQRSGWRPIFASRSDGNRRHTGKEDNRVKGCKSSLMSSRYHIYHISSSCRVTQP